MTRKCNVCGKKVEIPRKKGGNGKKINVKVKCPYCGAITELKIRRRNGCVRGLRQGFYRKTSPIK